MRRALSALVLCLAVLVCASADGRKAPADTPADVVERRGDLPPVRGEIERIDENGVVIFDERGLRQTIPWDRVRDVSTERSPPGAADLAQRLETAEQLWRARSRVQRHDAALAESLFEKLFEEYRGSSNETALIVAEGLLRCRLARGDHLLALVPALETARLRRAGESTEAYHTLPPVLDEETGLAPALPPVWSSLEDQQQMAARALLRDLERYDALGDEVIAAVAMLYAAALRMSMEEEAVEGAELRRSIPRDVRNEPGVTLLRDLVLAGMTEASDRHAARARLAGQMDDLPHWAEAWARFQVGRSLIAEGGAARNRGAVHLAHLPARFGRTQPLLANMALRELAAIAEAEGHAEAAASLREEIAHGTSRGGIR